MKKQVASDDSFAGKIDYNDTIGIEWQNGLKATYIALPICVSQINGFCRVFLILYILTSWRCKLQMMTNSKPFTLLRSYNINEAINFSYRISLICIFYLSWVSQMYVSFNLFYTFNWQFLFTFCHKNWLQVLNKKKTWVSIYYIILINVNL